MHGGQRLRPDAQQFIDRQSIQDVAHIVRADAAHAVGFVQVRGNFGKKLVRRDSHRGSEPGFP
jgi:hypothetical protein